MVDFALGLYLNSIRGGQSGPHRVRILLDCEISREQNISCWDNDNVVLWVVIGSDTGEDLTIILSLLLSIQF